MEFRNAGYILLAKFTAVVHFVFVMFYIASMYLVFFSFRLRFYAALYLSLVWMQVKFFKGCSLTKAERFFLNKSGKAVGEFFFINRLVNNFFKKTFNIPKVNVINVVRKTMFAFFILSSAIILLSILSVIFT